MLKIVKRGGLVVGTGVLVGLGVVGWLRFRPQDTPVANSQGGAVALNTDETPKSTAKPGSLSVISPGDVSANGGGTQTLGISGGGSTAGASTSSGGSSGSGSSGGSSKSWPGPEEFAQYEQYKKAEGAMIGEMIVGTGAAVAAGNVVTVNYRGWLTDGRLFDESYSGGKPYSFTEGAGRVIKGWEQGLFGMKVGGRRRLIIPPEFGYGAEGHAPIPGNAVLVFDVELLEVK